MRVNLLRETKQVLMEYGLNPGDVLWVGRWAGMVGAQTCPGGAEGRVT